MKKFTFRFVFINIIVLMFVSSIFSQDEMNKEEKLVGSDSDFLIGLHTGIFDCNQDFQYPFNIGLVGQYNYTPNVMKNWFFGAELGAFYTQNGEDGNLRNMKTMIGHLSIYPGYSIRLNKKEFPEEGDFESEMNSRNLNFAVGVTFGMPLNTNSDGSTYEADNANSGIGVTGLMSYDLTKKINLFGSYTFVGADMDGFGYDDSGNPTKGNDHKASYWAKIGVAYKLF